MKKMKTKGFTLMELIVVLLLIGVLSLAIYPILDTTMKIYFKIQNSTDFSQDAVSFFAFMDPLLKNDAQLTSIDSYNFAFSSGSNNYEITVLNYPSSLPPYEVILRKNSGAARTMLTNIAQTPDSVPGFQIVYFDQAGVTTNVLADIQTIQATLIFEENNVEHTFRSAFSLGETTEIVP
jgi:prepilin-type N-terminal cleavage/methylation domain-containing protein